jgi:hypothetical protein
MSPYSAKSRLHGFPRTQLVSLIHALLDFGAFMVRILLQTRLLLVHGQLTMNDTQVSFATCALESIFGWYGFLETREGVFNQNRSLQEVLSRTSRSLRQLLKVFDIEFSTKLVERADMMMMVAIKVMTRGTLLMIATVVATITERLVWRPRMK